MKKTYLKPERTITLTSFNRHILTAASPLSEPPTTGVDTKSSVDADVVESRRAFSVWDDEF